MLPEMASVSKDYFLSNSFFHILYFVERRGEKCEEINLLGVIEIVFNYTQKETC